MLDAEKIGVIIGNLIPVLKKNYTFKGWKGGVMPNFHTNYKDAVDYKDRISIHAEIGNFPEKLFKERSPNQTDKEAKYIRDNYKQVSLPVFIDYISTVTRPFHDANWSIDYQKDDTGYEIIGKTLQEYLEGLKLYGTLENFVKFIVPSKKAIDANGIIAVKPHSVFTVETIDGIAVDTQKLNEPLPYYYSSNQIISEIDGEYTMVLLKEKSFVRYGNGNAQIGLVFELYDDQNIYIIKQIGEFQDFNFETQIYFNHAMGSVPVIKLMGIPNITENGILWQSPFLFVTDILDLVILNSSNLQVSINMCVYPYRVMYGDVCEFKDENGNICSSGKIISHDGSEITCKECNGSGLKSRISPMGTMLIKPKSSINEGDSGLTQAPLSYVSPDITTLQFLRDKILEDENKARSMMNLHTSNTIVSGQGNVTATGMAIDLKAMYAFIKTISDQTFSIYEFIIDAIGKMRYGVNYKKPILTYPVTFDFKTEQDYLEQLKNSIAAGLPPFVIYSIIYRYLQTLYYNEKTTAYVFNLIIKTDRLVTLNNVDIALKLARGTVAKWEEILHTSAITFVQKLIEEDESFFTSDFTLQQDKLIQMAKDVADEIYPKPAPNNFNILSNPPFVPNKA